MNSFGWLRRAVRFVMSASNLSNLVLKFIAFFLDREVIGNSLDGGKHLWDGDRLSRL